jgi:hypothetical protein
MTSSQQSRIPAVSCQKVWKVFGGASTVKRILNPLIQKDGMVASRHNGYPSPQLR